MICSSHGFTNILTLQIYETELLPFTFTDHSTQEYINKLSFSKKFHSFLVSKFVKLSDELINHH